MDSISLIKGYLNDDVCLVLNVYNPLTTEVKAGGQLGRLEALPKFRVSVCPILAISFCFHYNVLIVYRQFHGTIVEDENKTWACCYSCYSEFGGGFNSPSYPLAYTLNRKVSDLLTCRSQELSYLHTTIAIVILQYNNYIMHVTTQNYKQCSRKETTPKMNYLVQ